jgi:hypothetical protein
MPAHLRVSLSDRPGALATLTRALAAVGANVISLSVVQRESGRAIDDLLLDWPYERPWDAVVRAVEGCSGARLHGLRHVSAAAATHDADLVQQAIRDPGQALEILIDGLPGLLLADWAALSDRRWPREPLFATVESPLPLPTVPAAVPRPRALSSGDMPPLAVVPCSGSDLRVLVGRCSGPAFTRTELERCAALVDVVVDATRLVYLGRPVRPASTVTSRLLTSPDVERTG